MLDVVRLFEEAVQLHKAGRLDEAAELYRQVVAAEPNHSVAWHFLGLTALLSQNVNQAIDCIQRALELDPMRAEAYCDLGIALVARGDLDQAIECLQRALALRPEFALAHSNLGNLFKRQNRLDLAIACYQRALAINPDFDEAYSNLGLALRESARPAEAVDCYRRALQRRPDDPDILNNLGCALREQGDFGGAIAACREALRIQPSLARGYFNLGNAFLDQGSLEEATGCYQRAIELNPNSGDVHGNLGIALHMLGRLDEALEYFRRAINLNSTKAEAHNNLGLAFQERGDFEAADACFRQAIDLNPEFAAAHNNIAGLMLLTGNYATGWSEYEWRLKTGLLFNRRFVQPRWDGSSLAGRKLLLHADGGLGDTIQFIRYAALIKNQNANSTVIVETQPRLMDLLASCGGVDCFIPLGQQLPAFDLHCPLLSLPGVYGTATETAPGNVPYLFADQRLVLLWRERLDAIEGRNLSFGRAAQPAPRAFLVGVNWRGQKSNIWVRSRDVPLTCFEMLSHIDGVRLISLQKEATAPDTGARNEESESRAGHLGGTIVDLGDFDTQHGAFMDTAAIMMNLDLVITSDTSVAHLAGALGVPVWVALPYVPDWRWLLDRSDSPWYPTMRLFRQKIRGDWNAPFKEIEIALRIRCEM